MRAWLIRASAMAVAHAVAQTLLTWLSIDHPTDMAIARPITLALLVGIAGLWGGIDGWLRKSGAGMTWFVGALIAGELAGLLSVIGQASFVDQTGVWALGPALTAGAAFTALLILFPAGLGIAVGRTLTPPHTNTGKPAQHAPNNV